MFDSAALEILIGLATLFFVLSIVCTSIVEGIASQLAWRGRNLENALRRLLNSRVGGPPTFIARVGRVCRDIGLGRWPTWRSLRTWLIEGRRRHDGALFLAFRRD